MARRNKLLSSFCRGASVPFVTQKPKKRAFVPLVTPSKKNLVKLSALRAFVVRNRGAVRESHTRQRIKRKRETTEGADEKTGAARGLQTRRTYKKHAWNHW